MSIQITKNKIEKLEDEIQKQRELLKEKGASLIDKSGLLKLNISETDLLKELKNLCSNLNKK